ncbi:hypothetical protein T03_8808 [Trichinella britovi]|uniref:Uncharacterized protein n=1 Tax=Trichinella britovi TaxID=45882 RepID=A0A0V1D6Z9_TRIBR|nr:hypothetical protein T03_8808 [Trichinella britovi]
MLQPEKDEKESSQQSTRIKIKEAKWKNVPEEKSTYIHIQRFFFFCFLEVSNFVGLFESTTLIERLAKEEKSKKNERKRTDPVDEQKSSDSRSIQHNINGLGETSNEFTGKSSREMGVHVEREKRRYTIERCALKCKPKATLVLEINA